MILLCTTILSFKDGKIINFINDNRLTVFVGTLIICAIFSLAMYFSYRRAKAQKWMLYFSWASAILGIQFLLRSILAFADLYDNQNSYPSKSHAYSNYSHFLLLILSITNTIFFFAAACDLEYKPPIFWFLRSRRTTSAFPKETIAVFTISNFFSSFWANIENVKGQQKKPLIRISVWALAIFAFVTSTVAHFRLDPSTWQTIFVARSVDSIFSGYCLAILGYSIYINVSPRKNQWAAISAMCAAMIYAILQLIYWFNPLFAHLLANTNYHEAVYGEMRALDTLLMAIALPVKVSILVPASFLLLRFMETLGDMMELQERSLNNRQDYLSSNGVVRLISEKLACDVDLTILLPGEIGRHLAVITFPNEDKEKRTRIINWDEADEVIRKALEKPSTKVTRIKNGSYIVLAPVRAHGVPIGYLKVSRKADPFSNMAVRQIQSIAKLISPAVQSFRELAGLDWVSIGFAEKQAENRAYSPKEAAQTIAEILHDIFSPVVTRLHLNFGFQNMEPIYEGNQKVAKTMRTEIDWTDWNKVPTNFTNNQQEGFKVFKKRVTAKSKDLSKDPEQAEKNSHLIGNLVFAIHRDNDKQAQRALGTNYLHRKTTAALISSAYLDFARDYYSSLLKDLGVQLSSRVSNIEEWFKPVNKVATKAGFSLVIAIQSNINTPLSTVSELVLTEILKGLSAENCIYADEDIRCYKLLNIWENVNYIIELQLPNSNSQIWVGIERNDFGEELKFASPWKIFLLDFAHVADAALTRVKYTSLLQQERLEAAHYQGLASASATVGTVIHQLSNMVHGQLVSTSVLVDALAVKKLITSEEFEQLIHSMKSSAEQQRKLLASITSRTKTTDRRPCLLYDVVKQAGDLYEVALVQRKISLNTNSIDKNLTLDVSFNVATLAIANVIGNAKDAMPKGGEIRIEAKPGTDMIECRVIDQGHGISKDIQGKIFDIGFTTKNGGGTGWGLYLTRHTLLENRSNIKLTATNEKGTTFTLYFPKSK